MLMPIVSMNKMAMNESVATTCCFRQVSTPTAVYWEVLNGGWIGSGYVTKLVYRDGFSGMNQTWLNSSFGKDLTTKGSGTTAQLAAFVTNNSLTYGSFNISSAAQWWLNAVGTGGQFSSLDTAIGNLSGGTIGVGSSCDHKNGNCKYKTLVQSYETNQHFEAKTAHADISAWSDPHGAVQFSS